MKILTILFTGSFAPEHNYKNGLDYLLHSKKKEEGKTNIIKENSHKVSYDYFKENK